MLRKNLFQFVFIAVTIILSSIVAKAGAYNTLSVNFNQQAWTLQAVSATYVDYTTWYYYDVEIETRIKYGDQTLNWHVVTGNAQLPGASDSITANVSDARSYDVTSHHYVVCRFQAWNWYWGWLYQDYLGYAPSAYIRTYHNNDFTKNPSGVYQQLIGASGVYMGSRLIIYTTPSYVGAADIDATGYKGDILLYPWGARTITPETPFDPGDTGAFLWTRSNGTHGPAVYTIEAPNNQMILRARIALAQPPPAGTVAQVRIRENSPNGTIIATANNVPISYPYTIVDNIVVNQGGFSPGTLLAMRQRAFYWEISYGNTGVWNSMSFSWQRWFTVFRNPYVQGTAIFENGALGASPLQYDRLYDEVVASGVSIGWGLGLPEEKDVLGYINQVTYGAMIYNPQTGNESRHPYEYFYYSLTCQCSDFANNLRGIARSTGIRADSVFYYGGAATSPRYSYWFRIANPDGNVYRVTMKISRPDHRDGIAKDPYFTFHNIVRWYDSQLGLYKYYDPAYGTVDPSLDLLQSIDRSITPPFCRGANDNTNRVLNIHSLGNWVNAIGYDDATTYCPYVN